MLRIGRRVKTCTASRGNRGAVLGASEKCELFGPYLLKRYHLDLRTYALIEYVFHGVRQRCRPKALHFK